MLRLESFFILCPVGFFLGGRDPLIKILDWFKDIQVQITGSDDLKILLDGDKKNNLTKACKKSNFKIQASKIGKNSKTWNFPKFLKTLNDHRLRTINAIGLQFSGFTSHTNTAKIWKKKKKIEDFWHRPQVKLAWRTL